MRALADRALLLRELADVGKPLLSLLTGMLLLAGLVPAATAVSLAALAELLARGGRYAELYGIQATAYALT